MDISTHLQFGELRVEVPQHNAYAKQFEAMHLGLDKAAPVIAASLLPDSAKPAHSCQDSAMALVPGRCSFHGLAFLRVRMIACTPSCALIS